jgi:hypothetical protein
MRVKSVFALEELRLDAPFAVVPVVRSAKLLRALGIELK